MRFCHIILLVVALLVNADPAAASKESKLTARGSSTRSVIEDNASPKRLLRAEERAVSVNLPGLEKITNALTSAQTKELQKLVKAGETVDDSFASLGLAKMLPLDKKGNLEVGTKTVSKFLSGDKFKAWTKYTTQLNQKDADETMFKALMNAYGEKNAAIIILLGKDSWRSSAIAKRLELRLFYKWYTVDKFQNADEALKGALKTPRRTIREYPREMSIWDNYGKFVSKVVRGKIHIPDLDPIVMPDFYLAVKVIHLYITGSRSLRNRLTTFC